MQEQPKETSKNWVLAITSLASFMVALDTQVLTAALAHHPRPIRRPDGNAAMDGQCLQSQFRGAAPDRRGARRPVRPAPDVCRRASSCSWHASVACALSTGIFSLIAARVVQGAGSALIMPLGMALLSAAFPREERARALGIFSGVVGLALLAGPAIGGAITESFGWPWIFWINMPIGLLRPHGPLRGCARVSARQRSSISPAWCWSRPPHSRWSGRCCAATSPAGAAPKW